MEETHMEGENDQPRRNRPLILSSLPTREEEFTTSPPHPPSPTRSGMACVGLPPCLRLLLPCLFFFFLCFIRPTSCSSSTGRTGRHLLQTNNSTPAENAQTFFPSNPISAFPNSSSPPSPTPQPVPSPTSPIEGDGGGGGSECGSSVAKAVVATFFATLVLSCLIFFLFFRYDRKRRHRRDQHTNPYSNYNTNGNANYNKGGGRSRRRRRRDDDDGEDDVKGVIVDENGLDVFYWRKMEEGGVNLCRYCKAALHHTTNSNTHSTDYDEDDQEDEHDQRDGGRRGRRPWRRRRRRNQATPLLPVGSVRSEDPSPPIYSASSSISSQPNPPPPPQSHQASTHRQNEETPQNIPPSPLPVNRAQVVAAPQPPPPPPPPPKATTSALPTKHLSDESAPPKMGPPPPPPPKAAPPLPPPTKAGPFPPPPPALPKRAGPPPPPLPGPKKDPPPVPGGKPPMASPRPPPMPPGGEGGPTKRAQLPPPAKLKPLHWDKMTTANVQHSMVWDKIPSDGSFRFDDELMVALFGTAAMSRNPNDASTHNRTGSGGSSGSTGQASQQQQIVLLDPRKSQNIAIVLRSLAIGRQTIINALLDGQGLSGDTLEKLCNAPRPTKEEEGLLLGFSDDPSKLADADAFLYHLLRSVPTPFDRLEAMLFRSTFDHEVGQVKESLLVLESACKAIKGSVVFPKLLAAVLKAGNRMNAGTARGNAQAFNLASLRKLSDVKSTDGKTTLLHFLVEEVVRSEGKRRVINKTADTTMTSSSSKEEKEREYMTLGLPVIGGLSAEFATVKKAAPIDHDALVATCTMLETKVKDLKRVADNAGDSEFEKEIRSFLESAEKDLATIQEEKERVLDVVTRTTEYYVVGASKDRNFKPLQLFVIIKDFLTMVDQVCADVARKLQQQQQQLEKKRRLRQQQEEQQQQQEQTDNAVEPSSVSETISDQSPSGSERKFQVTFPNFPAHFLRRNSSDSDSDSDDGFAD